VHVRAPGQQPRHPRQAATPGCLTVEAREDLGRREGGVAPTAGTEVKFAAVWSSRPAARLRADMRRYVGSFEIVAIGWVALLASGGGVVSAVVMALAGLFVIVRVRPLVVYWRTHVPAPPRGLWSRLSAPGRGDATYWAFFVLFMWTGAVLSALRGNGYPAAVGFVAGLAGWGALRFLIDRLTGDPSGARRR